MHERGGRHTANRLEKVIDAGAITGESEAGFVE